MTPRTRKALLTFAKLGWLWLVAACDPNVVIGAKLRGAGSAPTGGSAPEMGGFAGVQSTAGVAGNGPAGTGGGAAGDNVGGTPGDAGATGEGGEGGEPPGELLFEASHEQGDLAEWDEGPDTDAGGYYADPGIEPPELTTDQTHSGSGAVRVTVDTGAGDKIARLYRRITEPDAYYSAWFYLAEDHSPSSWWSIFLFRAVKDRNASIDLWSVDLVERDDEQLTFAVFDHATNTLIASPAEPVVEVGKWFQLEAFLHQVAGEPSQVIFYLDGVEFLALDDATTVPDDEPVYWVIGNGGAELAPTVSTVYIDDAAISKTFIEP
jgi:hypothetical protein